MLSIKRIISNPRLLGFVVLQHFFKWLPDRIYLVLLYRFRLGKRLDLTAPKSYNEKLQWLKLYDRRPEYSIMVDKYAVKDYVSRIIGSEYVIPTLGVWDAPDKIEWNLLPKQFVIKTTHGGGSAGVIICKDKTSFNFKNAITKLDISMKQDIYGFLREWPYKNVPHRIIAEEFIEASPSNSDLQDYKFFCFNGKVKALFVATDRQTPGVDVKFDFFDADFNHLPLRQGHDNATVTPSKPRNFELMKQLAEKLSCGIPQVRIDFYDLGSKVLFGEMTFFHFSGLMPFEPDEWDHWFGQWIVLP